MSARTIFVVNSIITVAYGVALLLITDLLLAVYGITPPSPKVCTWLGGSASVFSPWA
jgi:hypothetical protein